ncbi:hypothetical protein ACHAWF_017682 [Thalassiosira exigua]
MIPRLLVSKSTSATAAGASIRRRLLGQTTRSIATGTDLASSSSAPWQRARPWHDDDVSGSNLASDNAVSASDLFAPGKKVAVFGVPAPYTGVCTHAHYPPYKALAAKFKTKGVDEVVCYSVADPYAHYNWAKNMGNDFGDISFLADVDGEWAREHGLDRDYTAVSLGHRSARFSMIVADGCVKSFNIVEDAEKDAETLLDQA